MKKLGRNDLCWCGSGKKYKHCHEAFDEKLMEAADAGHQIPDHDMIKTPEQIEGIRESCKINVAVLDYVAEHIRPGISTAEIDRWVHEETVRRPAWAESRRRLAMKDSQRACAHPSMIRSATAFRQRMSY